MNKNFKKLYIFFTFFYAYFVLALFECARGNFIPFFIDEFAINNTSISFIVSISQFGCVIGSYLAGLLSQKYGQKLTLIIGTALCSIVALSSGLLSNIVLLCLFYTVFNIGRSFLCLSGDTTIPTVSFGYEVILINFTHFMYGMGSFTGQRALKVLLSSDVPWRSIYVYVGILFIVCAIFSLFIKLPRIKYINSNTDNKSDNIIDSKEAMKLNKKSILKNPVFYALLVCFAFSNLGEGIMTTWFINYMTSCYELGASRAASISSVFFITFAIGRLLGGIILNKVGKIKGLSFSMLAAAILFFAGLILKENGLYLVASTGLFISILYPTLIVIAVDIFKDYSSYAIGVLNTFNSLIYIIFTILIGMLNDAVGSYLTFFVSTLFMIIAFIAMRSTDKYKKNQA